LLIEGEKGSVSSAKGGEKKRKEEAKSQLKSIQVVEEVYHKDLPYKESSAS
jgi:hypothetical protein